ncbi:hypothetical protein ID866_9532 [Astraeus odoratus]|nr:hypothetical protein ID866_9532 [Astraeus odoratus]
MAQGIDACYWECKSEISCQTKTNPQPSSSKQSSSGGSSSRQSGSSSSTNSSTSKPTSNFSVPDLLGILAKDSKLTAMEYLCCIKNAPCLFCGLPGHLAKDFPRSMSHVAKACAAQAASIAVSTVEKPAEMKKYPDSLKLVVYIPDYGLSDVITLLDSGSSYCFIDPSNSFITQLAHFSVHFPSGNVTPFSFYVTPLDSSCILVLGYNWLTHYNLLIDWVLGSINFHSVLQGMPIAQDPPTASGFPKQSQPTMEEVPEVGYSPFLSPSPPSDLP